MGARATDQLTKEPTRRYSVSESKALEPAVDRATIALGPELSGSRDEQRRVTQTSEKNARRPSRGCVTSTLRPGSQKAETSSDDDRCGPSIQAGVRAEHREPADDPAGC